MKMLKISSITIISGAIILTNFVSFPTAMSVIKPPAPIKTLLAANPSTKIDKNIQTAVKKFLPKNAVLTNPSNPSGTSSIQLKDLDGDGKNEVIFVYKINDNEGNSGLTVLKEKDGSYEKAAEYRTQGIGVDFLTFAPITGANKNDLVVGWTVGATLKGMDIFTWDNNSLKKINSDWYTKIEVEDMPNKSGVKDGIAEIALWKHDTGEAYITDVYKLKGNKLAIDNEVYPYYFKKVAEYYQGKVKEMPGAAFYWYYLADAQLKAGNPSEAKKAVQKGIDILKGCRDCYPDIENYNKLLKSANDMLK